MSIALSGATGKNIFVIEPAEGPLFFEGTIISAFTSFLYEGQYSFDRRIIRAENA
ncbi:MULTISPECIES: hypothetical protein [unclassified Bartonella]|uniref:hypothetical protein n=1 Tax=unclassified Bartonella TaxID=2645622 RepID=UPI0035CEADE8